MKLNSIKKNCKEATWQKYKFLQSQLFWKSMQVPVLSPSLEVVLTCAFCVTGKHVGPNADHLGLHKALPMHPSAEKGPFVLLKYLGLCGHFPATPKLISNKSGLLFPKANLKLYKFTNS